MHGVGHAVIRVVGVERGRLVLHEQSVTALMERGEDVGEKELLIIVSGHAHIHRPEIRGERVLGGHQDRGGGTKPLPFQQPAGEGLLLGDRAGPGKKVLADAFALGEDAARQRYDPLAQGGEKGVELLFVPAGLKVIQTGVVIGFLLFVSQIDGAAGEIHQPGKAVAENGIIRGLFGLQPAAVALGSGKVAFIGEGRALVFGFLPVAIQKLHGPALLVVQSRRIRVKLREQRHVALGVRQSVQALSQHGHILSGLFHALGRSAALHIKAYFAQRPAVGLRLVQNGAEFFPPVVFHFILLIRAPLWPARRCAPGWCRSSRPRIVLPFRRPGRRLRRRRQAWFCRSLPR